MNKNPIELHRSKGNIMAMTGLISTMKGSEQMGLLDHLCHRNHQPIPMAVDAPAASARKDMTDLIQRLPKSQEVRSSNSTKCLSRQLIPLQRPRPYLGTAFLPQTFGMGQSFWGLPAQKAEALRNRQRETSESGQSHGRSEHQRSSV